VSLFLHFHRSTGYRYTPYSCTVQVAAVSYLIPTISNSVGDFRTSDTMYVKDLKVVYGNISLKNMQIYLGTFLYDLK